MSAIIPDSSNPSTGDAIAKDAALLDSIDLSSTMDLHRSNLMRMQVAELLEECKLDLKGRKWAMEAHEYLQNVTELVSQAAKHHFVASSKSKNEDATISVRNRADKEVLIGKIAGTAKKGSCGIAIEPIGCTKSQFGWTKKSGNAQMLPTFSLMAKLPAELFSSKDFMKYRYFDVRIMKFHLVEFP